MTLATLTLKKQDNTQLSAHFKASEFDCPCGQCNETKINTDLVELLEDVHNVITEILGHEFPIKVSSGYRCETHNATVPGAVSGSQHPLGNAADVIIPNKYHQVISILVGKRGGVGFYPDRLHIDCRGSKARWEHNK